MEVILLERVAKLGQMGDVVTVKPGYARNYLLLQGKALTASKENIAQFESQKAQLEANNLETKKEAEALGERLDGEVGNTIALDQVMMVGGDDAAASPQVGTPRIEGASVTAEVLEQGKGAKVIVFKKKRRKNYRRKRGHRQLQTVLRIRDIAVA